jgi:hypothetical protein
MEHERQLNDINLQLEALVGQRKQILIKLCKYKLMKLLEIPFEINDYVYDQNENRRASVYIPSLLLQIDITTEKNNTFYDVYYSDVEHAIIYKNDIDSPIFNLMDSVFPGFREIFLDRLDEWFNI